MTDLAGINILLYYYLFFVNVLLFLDIINILLYIESKSSRQKRKLKVKIIVIQKEISPYAYKYYIQNHKVRYIIWSIWNGTVSMQNAS